MNRREYLRTMGRLTIGIGCCSMGCRSAPMTGRSQLMLIPESQEITMGNEAYRTVLQQEQVSANPRLQEMVQRVGARIASVSGRPDYQWEFKLLDSKKQNAFCLPGGKVAVYEGILPICESIFVNW